MTERERVLALLGSVAQAEFDDSMTSTGRIADQAYVGRRIAVTLLSLLDEAAPAAADRLYADVSSWVEQHSGGLEFGCVICGARENVVHLDWCSRDGHMWPPLSILPIKPTEKGRP